MDGIRLLVFVSIGAFVFSGCSPQSGKVNQVTSSFDAIKCRTTAAIETEFIVQWENGKFSVEKGVDPEQFKDEFVTPQVEQIKHVQINQKIHLVNPVVEQAGELSSQAANNWGQNVIHASSVWSAGYKGQNIKVAVVDSIVDVDHPQLRTRIDINSGEIPNNGIDDDNNGYVDDYAGAQFFSGTPSSEINDHGSHVAGIIAADPTQGAMSGVAPEAQIIPATFLDGSGAGTLGDAILAMQFAAARGAKIINASWGGTGCSEALGNAFVDLNNKGILLVVAAGNSGADIDETAFYPAVYNLPGQITVSASDSSDLVPAWSNTGFKNAHLTAPGVEILSTAFGGRYVSMDGTSMASPFVAGAAATLWSARPSATAAQIKAAILRGVDVISGKNSKTLTRGRLNLQNSLDELRRLVP
jgi:subtilisin family serine protease